jgi:hypothetical protein
MDFHVPELEISGGFWEAGKRHNHNFASQEASFSSNCLPLAGILQSPQEPAIPGVNGTNGNAVRYRNTFHIALSQNCQPFGNLSMNTLQPLIPSWGCEIR